MWLLLTLLLGRRTGSGEYTLDGKQWFRWELTPRELRVEGTPCKRETPYVWATDTPMPPVICKVQLSPSEAFEGWVALVEKVGGAVR